ncbi:MAG: amidohydrolase [Phycisphaera sp.]|nr:MAG: amidohydrolase [Phycisphaera sp.]
MRCAYCFYNGYMKHTILALTLAASSAAAQPDSIFVNARVYTVDEAFSVAEAFAVEDGMFAAVGSEEEIRALAADSTKVIDLGGMTVLPGLIDAHGHMAGLGQLQLGTLDLAGMMSFEEVINRVVERAETTEPGEWIIGRGWDNESWENKELPNHHELSQAIPEHPVLLSRVDGHAALANQRALEANDISPGTAIPNGGEMLMDDHGEPTGVFIDNAISLVRRVIPESTVSGEDLILAAQDMCLAVGLTGVHDAGVAPDMIDVYMRLESEYKLKVRVHGMIPGTRAPAWFAENKPYHGPFFSMRSAKLFIDGAMGSRGAWMLEPYKDRPFGQDGEPYVGLALAEPGLLQAIAEDGLEKGYQVCIHAIGDRANREVLDLYERAASGSNLKDARFRIEHAQLLAPEDIGRFAELGIIPSMQPTHCTSDMRWIQDRVGPVRADGAYAWQSLLASGVRIASGSDFPVESHNPFLGLYAAVTRQNLESEPAGGWHPTERMSREQALRSFTINAAYAGFNENSVGSIEVDKLADFIVIDRDYMHCSDRDIADTVVLSTWIEGTVVYQEGHSPK